jgi:glycerol-3-phosphate O-acyltransferase
VEIMRRINASAAVNPVNLVALVTLCMPKLAIEEHTLATQIGLYQRLLAADASHHDYGVTQRSPAEIIAEAESLGMLDREDTPFGPVLSHSPLAAVLITWYRNNVAHVLALPSLLACLVYNRRRPIHVDSLTRMARVVLPFVAEELTGTASATDVPRWLGHLQTAGLLVSQDDSFAPPPARSPAGHQLRLLARVIMPVLERLYIVVGLLFVQAGTPPTREALQARSTEVAARMSRLYGLNAPEFFDARLFNQFVDALLRERLISEAADGTLRHGPVVEEVLRAAETVIDPDFRFAVLLERPT